MVTPEDIPLVVLAAGKGRRFGGLKQQWPVGLQDETLPEFNLVEAVRAGLRTVCFIISPGAEAEWQPLVDRWRDRLDIHVAVQPPELLPGKYPDVRDRPWGTAHALLAVEQVIHSEFILINGDDYYGPEAISRLAASAEHPMALAAYRLADTLSASGPVNRGRCLLRGNILSGIEEYTDISESEGVIRGRNQTGETQVLEPDTPVSMNCWRLNVGIFAQIRQTIEDMVRDGTYLSGEIFLPSVIQNGLIDGEWIIEVEDVSGPWYGLTFRDDLPAVRAGLQKLQAELYTVPLWNPD